MVTGDGAYIKKINRGIILEKIIEHGMISRADLSKITGLNKATISAQVSDLLEEGLVSETQMEHHNVGRKPIMLSINQDAGYTLGVDLDYEEIHFTLADLQGTPVHSYTEIPSTHDYEDIVKLLIKQVKRHQKKSLNSRYGLVSVMVGIHGTVNKDESIYFVPKYGWRNRNLKHDLKDKLDLDIYIENNANLSSYAERVFKFHSSNNLVNIILSSGIGAGIIVDGEIHRGYHGYAGEMGHMIVSLDGRPCSCGNKGCWELYASEPSMIKQLSSLLGKEALTRKEVLKLITERDSVVMNQISSTLPYISIGLNNVINLYNPETIVINSEILANFPNAVELIESHLHSSVSQYCQLVLSELGDRACILGACALALQRFLEVPKLTLKTAQVTQSILV
ncbi:ROK family transcriptional regulator [Neobacillus dielmonensis]|uniref:ROK family transcriptional regulator n=1 Tax=Neobacillus dielmonensis TaxID=1347369 RepID=UPI0005AA0679|nr:ROK family transcriptional regulator [Neobacillus dielmonensis]